MDNEQDNFDIIDFDINEYSEELEKEEKKKQEKLVRFAPQKKKKKKNDDENMPNRDMLKTILMILVVIVIACLFLGFITFIVNHASGGKDNKVTTEDLKLFQKETTNTAAADDRPESVTTQKSAKENLEDNIEDITKKVKEDTKKKTTQKETQQETAATQAPVQPEETVTAEPATETVISVPDPEVISEPEVQMPDVDDEYVVPEDGY